MKWRVTCYLITKISLPRDIFQRLAQTFHLLNRNIFLFKLDSHIIDKKFEYRI